MTHEHDRTAAGVCVGCVEIAARNEERNRICVLIKSLQRIYGGDAHARTLGRLMARIRIGEHRPARDR